MTVESLSTKVIYKGNGAATVFPVPFQYSRTDTIYLVFTDAEGRDALITANFEILVSNGATSVVYPIDGAPIPSGTKLTLYRNTPLTQIVDLIYGGAFNPDVLESDGFDRVVMMIQELQEQLDRAVKVSISEENPPATAEGFYADIRAFADAAAGSASASEESAKRSELAANISTAAAETATAGSAAAAASAAEAADSENLARKWAVNPYNSVVLDGQYSALHWATVAADKAAETDMDLIRGLSGRLNALQTLLADLADRCCTSARPMRDYGRVSQAPVAYIDYGYITDASQEFLDYGEIIL